MRILVFGAKGQLGKDLVSLFGIDAEVAGHDLPGIDIADVQAASGAVQAFAPDLVINAAAATDVDGAEEDRAGAFRVNETGARNVAAAAAVEGAPVVYYSTDYVFGGAQTRPYVPEDIVAPIGVYAQSKAAGEAATRKANPKHFIIRTAWLYGPGGNNFVEKILRAAAKFPSLRVVEDEVGSPTHTLDLAKATAALVKTDAYGTYHAVNAGSCSRFDLARAIVELAGLTIPVSPCPSSEFPTKAERPLYSVLATDKLESATGYVMRPWHEALESYMARRDSHA